MIQAEILERLMKAKGRVMMIPWPSQKPDPGCKVEVRVLDAKIAFGRCRILVEPIAGEGSTWVNAFLAPPDEATVGE